MIVCPYNMAGAQLAWPEPINQGLSFFFDIALSQERDPLGVAVEFCPTRYGNYVFPMTFKGFPLVSEGRVLGSLFARKGDRRGVVFYFGPTGPGNHVLPIVFQGFPITVSFPMRRRGTQQNAPYAICPNMQKPMVSNDFHGMAL